MSFKTWLVFEVACDRCASVHDSACDAYSEGDAVADAERDGWAAIGLEIYCPTCSTPSTPITDRRSADAGLGRRAGTSGRRR